MTTNTSKGGWKAEYVGEQFFITAGDQKIADVYAAEECPAGTGLANAELMAKAPKMYELLKEALEVLESRRPIKFDAMINKIKNLNSII